MGLHDSGLYTGLYLMNNVELTGYREWVWWKNTAITNRHSHSERQRTRTKNCGFTSRMSAH